MDLWGLGLRCLPAEMICLFFCRPYWTLLIPSTKFMAWDWLAVQIMWSKLQIFTRIRLWWPQLLRNFLCPLISFPLLTQCHDNFLYSLWRGVYVSEEEDRDLFLFFFFFFYPEMNPLAPSLMWEESHNKLTTLSGLWALTSDSLIQIYWVQQMPSSKKELQYLLIFLNPMFL